VVRDGEELRILSVIETLGLGGAEQALLNLCRSLGSRGHHCEVAVLFPPYDLAVEFEAAGIRVHRLGISHRFNLPQGALRLARTVLSGRFQVVHAHLLFAGWYLSLAGLLVRHPVRVVSFHNLGYDSYPANTAWRRLRKALDGWLIRRGMDGMVGVSRAAAEHYRQHLSLAEVEVIPNAVSCELQPGGAQPELPADYVIMPGRLVREKAHLSALRALALLRGEGVRPPLLIVGSGPQESAIRQGIEELGLTDQVRLLASLPQAELFPLVQGARFVLQSSSHEGFSLVAAEAHLLGVPVVATRVGAIPEIVCHGESGLLVDTGDDTALAGAISELWRHPERRERMGRAGRLRVEEHLGVESVARRWEAYYRRLISRRRSSGAP